VKKHNTSLKALMEYTPLPRKVNLVDV